MYTFSILNVEDNESNRIILEAMLSRYFNRIDSCESGEEALDRLYEGGNNYDLVMLDVLLPGMSGIEVAQILRETEQTRELPIICVSALALDTDRAAGLQAGADAYISKPYMWEEVFQTIQQVFLKRGKAIALM